MKIANKTKNLSFVICHLFVIWILSFGIFLSGCAFENDVDFARRILNDLINGRYSARTSLDWPHLKMMFVDVGAQYSKFQSDEARLNYERSFITNFSQGFKEKGGKIKNFSNWRLEQSRDPKCVLVEADCPDKNTTFYFTIQGQGLKRKIIRLTVLHKIQPGEKVKQVSKPETPAPQENSISGVGSQDLQPMEEQK